MEAGEAKSTRPSIDDKDAREEESVAEVRLKSCTPRV